MQSFFIGLLIIGAGVGMLKYTQQAYEFLGTWTWAERFFGIGGTITAIKLVGIAGIVFGAVYMMGGVG